jgi:hypothetical protein
MEQKIVTRYPKDFPACYSIPERCEICGDFVDPVGEDPDNIEFETCVNGHTFCKVHLIRLDTLPKNHPLFEAIAKKDKLNYEELTLKYQLVSDHQALDGENLLADKYQFYQNLVKVTPVKNQVRHGSNFRRYRPEYYRGRRIRPKSKKFLVPWFNCPLCTGFVVKEHDFLTFLLQKWHISQNDAIILLRQEFSTMADLEKKFCEFEGIPFNATLAHVLGPNDDGDQQNEEDDMDDDDDEENGEYNEYYEEDEG